ncbi:nucleotide-diphospho-sugar transferase [Microthyrium microscopicum]|uniref:UDP-N-acetylglucosamine diphosphorylase n=1 Tax=Microthyrium microscopicum TaxID=703497 RepID=A0A6A6TVK6_9PEZI|nr:nucleotide-diphospho-sugar transferase [Microthyrium microscopicum]
MAAALKETVQNLLGGASAKGPAEPTPEDLQNTKQKYESAGQGQVFTFWDSLSSAEKGALYNQLKDIDPEHVNKLVKKVHEPKADSEGDSIEPLPTSATSSILDSKQEDLDKWYESGLKYASDNQVGVVLMAGGQGTRLGSSAPKGCYDIGLPSKKSLFQLQAERIHKLELLAAKKYGKSEAVIPWYVMTSGPTRGPTEQFFKENNYFGLKAENVFVFEQGILPCISNDGKIIMESKSKVAVAPDGNGGLYQALITSGAVADMTKRGVKHIHAYCVDNCLVRVADPVFIGFAASKIVDIATKVVRKRNAKESVGMILSRNGKPDVVEYSEISDEMAEAKDSSNSDLLKYRAGNIVNHYYSIGFLESIPEWAHKLPHHVAKKKIPYVDLQSGNSVKPDKPNGIKLEQFVFDCFPFLTMDKFAAQEVRREDEFSPLKNARGTGEDDPDTSKADILGQGRRWLEAAGAIVEDDGGNPGFEVSPLFSYGGEGLEEFKGKSVKAPGVLEMDK